ncbi:pentatricopeptide repeat-containing protein At1g71490 [Punica granatum]|uniref:Pentatricopeptide repeat-containing protein At1g71490 n=1 Tax=Punica granatum TaxID=22663 RepID=A0A6P8D9Z2_PUNGR|nr:pentatricopeptide repeat-containing protein At1g71490 [Punica granatum]XP_031393504.1 pentatricopeptide repeat-containing protein At1g71490 [Punica granatum]XP_031393505.1 pentatricopeptide repeat-containing protein At1g71490 [Punica granatum]XP_031393506.1 pentatricopeptide repeat-containing protein At1g71490 [Punica granatum]
MPSPTLLVLNGLCWKRIVKTIPRKWKQIGSAAEFLNSEPLKSLENAAGTLAANEESMVESFLRSLKDFAGRGNVFDAFRTFSQVQLQASSPGIPDAVLHSISSLLLACTNFEFLAQGKQLHAHAISLGVEQHPILAPRLVRFYSAFNLLVDAHTSARNSNILHPLPWNLLISSYVRNESYEEVISVYKDMLSKGIRPDNFTYPSVLKACGEKMEVDLGRGIHGTIEASPSRLDLFVQNSLISMYGKLGQVVAARHMFDQMAERDAISWNSMVCVYASKGMWKQAFELFDHMLAEGTEMNIIIWNTIAGGCLQVGNYKRALELVSQIRTQGSHLDSVALIICLGACSHLGNLRLGKEIHGYAIRHHYHGLINVRNAMITMYSRCKHLRHAYTLFESTESKSIITWNSMLSGYCHMDQSEEASSLFRKMLLSGVEPNYITIASILPLCARVANLQHGKEFHCYLMRRDSFDDYLLLWNALVDMYARSGKVFQARRVFDMMTLRDEVTYTSLISGYGILGEGLVALTLFEEMLSCGIKPDHVTMVAVLSACSHSGLVVQGEKLFQKMQSLYDLTPRLEHYACMVDLFGRAGLLYKAKQAIVGMPYRPTAAMWATLLGACQIYRNKVIGEWAAGKLLEMRPENSGYYVLIANMYAAADSWGKLKKVRTLMRDLGVKKAPGCAWINTGNGFQSFLVEDTSNPQGPEIYSLLEQLSDEMKDDGYATIEEEVSMAC